MAGPTLFFVCGCPKSGTTWVQLMLDRHPEVSCAGESQLVVLVQKFSRLIEDHNTFQRQRNETIFGDVPGLAPFPEIAHDDERWLYAQMIARLLGRTVRKPGVRAIGDKTPNVADHLGWLRGVLREAKFIHVIRDGRDVAVSGWHHLHRTSPDEQLAQKLVFRDYAVLVAQLWRETIERARTVAADMPDRYLEVRYEELQTDPDRELERMLGFLGVAQDAAVRQDCIAASRFETLTGRAPGREDARAFLRKGVSGDWRNWFDPELAAAFAAAAGPLLIALGY
jgi:hypothetical protein